MKTRSGLRIAGAIVAVIAPLVSVSCSVFGIRSEEQPQYQVLRQEGAIEVRQYGETLVARTEVKGSYDEAGSVAFRRIADYIFGKNSVQQKISMTAPVLQENRSQKIAMTAPVLQEKSGDTWSMSFVMPAKYSLETLPVPLDPAVQIMKVPPRKVAVIRYTGVLSEENIIAQSLLLLEWLEKQGHITVSIPRSAGYDPPWTIPFLRRNEVMVDIE